jgi:hypothetical protein
LEDPCSAPTPHTKPAQGKPSDDPAGGAYDHDNADSHPDDHPCTAPRASGEKHERVVVARLDAGGEARGDREPSAGAGGEWEATWTDGEPRPCRAVATAADDS